MRRVLLLCGLFVAAMPIGHTEGRKNETFTSIWTKYQSAANKMAGAKGARPTVGYCDSVSCTPIVVKASVSADNLECTMTIVPEYYIVTSKDVDLVWDLDVSAVPATGNYRFAATKAIDFHGGPPSDIAEKDKKPKKQTHTNKNSKTGAHRYDVHLERDDGRPCRVDPIIVNSG